jgi:hypothetical protein
MWLAMEGMRWLWNCATFFATVGRLGQAPILHPEVPVRLRKRAPRTIRILVHDLSPLCLLYSDHREEEDVIPTRNMYGRLLVRASLRLNPYRC